MDGTRLLIAEDEPRVRAALRRGFTEEGFSVLEAGDGAAALATAGTGHLDVVILDWMLPRTSGIEVLRALRAARNLTPVLMLTVRDEVSDRTLALNSGADDYVQKPFAFEELLARVRAVLRRSTRKQLLSCADLAVDPAARTVSRGGREIRVTVREFQLLHFLVEGQGRAV